MKTNTQENVAYLLSWVGRLLVAASGVAMGGSLAVFSLMAQPVEVVKKAPAPEAEAAGKVFYQPGERDGTRAKAWSSKRKGIFAGQAAVYSFSEEELNAWFGTTFRTPPKSNPKSPAPDVVGEGLNFRVAGGVLQVALPLQLNYFADPMKLVVQAKGSFASDGSRWYFSPQEIWVGSLPAHRLPGLTSLLIAKQLDESWVPADALAAWKRIAEMNIDDRTVLLRLE